MKDTIKHFAVWKTVKSITFVARMSWEDGEISTSGRCHRWDEGNTVHPVIAHRSRVSGCANAAIDMHAWKRSRFRCRTEQIGCCGVSPCHGDPAIFCSYLRKSRVGKANYKLERV